MFYCEKQFWLASSYNNWPEASCWLDGEVVLLQPLLLYKDGRCTQQDGKDGFSTFLYTDADADPQHPFFILQGEVAPNRPQLHSSLKKKSGTVHDNWERAIHEGRLDRWHNSWVNKSGVIYIEAMMWLVECIGHKGTYHIWDNNLGCALKKQID